MAVDPISNPSSSSGVGVGEVAIELLKNTPSNIAKLEDVIDQCKGREKYLARTRSPSDGEDVRWYFCKVPLAENELAASVPRTTVVGKGEYFRFAMRDSLALEASFLQREEDLLSAWWKEYGECSEGPSGSNINALPNLDLQSKSHSSEGEQPTKPCEDVEERVGVPVKGGLYEVDLAKRHCFPVYWNGENRRVLRGHWFARKDSLDWLPLREDVAEQLELAYRRQVWHRRTFQPSGLFAARVNLQGPLPGLHALFTGEDDTWEAWLNNDTSGFSSIINLKGNGIKLRRGYSPSGSPKPTQDEVRQQKEEEMDDYCSQVPVQHLVFMVHGIGQRLEKANLVDDVGNFRQITASLAERHLSSYQRDTQRVLFIPCQWRRGLKLGSESTVDSITLDGVRGLRIMLSATAHDILYYMSPIYCQEIMNSVSNQLNLLYNKFLKRNPGYDGKVSIYAHSLGSVLSYDILCHQDDLSSLSPLKPVHEEHVTEEHPNQNGEPSQLRSILCSENNNSDTATEKLDSFQEENTEVQGSIANDSPNSELQHAALMTHPDSNLELCQESLGPKLSTDLSSEDLNKPCPRLSLEGKNSEVCSGDVDNMQEDLHKQCPSAYLEDKNSGVCSGHVDNLPEDLHKPCSSASLEDNDSVICSGDVDNRQERTSNNTNDKEKLIELLMKEVDSLKARIGDLESKNSDEDSKVNHQDDSEGGNMPNQCISGKRLEKLTVRNYYTPSIKYTKLDFKVDTFFAVGSPLGVFLALRNVRLGIGNGKDYWQDESIIEEMPACRQMFNIFHPFDPVAYRVDPLVCKEYVNKRPVTIPYHKGGKRLHIGLQDFTEDLALRSQAVVNQFNSITVKVISVCQSRKNDDMDETATSSSDYDERSYGSLMMERLTGNREGQIDHMLQDKTFEHQYISAIGSHTNYWRDYDTALFILNHLYRDIPEEPDSPVHSEANTSNNQKAPKGRRFYQSDTVDDELPLTFSDRMNAREFSRKVRRAIKKNS